MIACAPHAKLGSLCESAGWLEVELLSVEIEKPEDLNLVLGQAHFIKTVEDRTFTSGSSCKSAHACRNCWLWG